MICPIPFLPEAVVDIPVIDSFTEAAFRLLMQRVTFPTPDAGKFSFSKHTGSEKLQSSCSQCSIASIPLEVAAATPSQ